MFVNKPNQPLLSLSSRIQVLTQYFGLGFFLLSNPNPLDLVIPEPDDERMAVICSETMQNLDRVDDMEVLEQCQAFYWHNQFLDQPPGSYQNVARIIQRSLELDPFQPDQFSNLAFLRYSQWCLWKKHPEEAPYGLNGALDARKILEIGGFYNWDVPRFHLEAGIHFTTVARYHDETYYTPAIQFLERAAELSSGDPAAAARALISLGHVHRALDHIGDARACYQRALEVDPGNSIAEKQIRMLNAQVSP
jgi:tetratricopeptide (TPR) repeat protein